MSERFYIGIDLGGTNIAVGVTDSNGNILGRAKKKTLAYRHYSEIFNDMAECAELACKNACLDFDAVECVGIGAPGAIDIKNGIIERSENLGFENVPVVSYMEEKLNRKVYIENDANAAAWGEYLVGAGKDCNSMVMITLGTGVGGGIIENGRILSGAYGMGGEIGHMVIKSGGEECNCDRRGCFEAYASATALVKQTKKAMCENPESEMWKLVNGNIDLVNGLTAFKANDSVAHKVVDNYLFYLSEGVINIVNLLQPELICIGGGISHEGERIIEPVIKAVKEFSYARNSKRQTKIALATLRNDAGIIGAALLGK